MMIKLGGIVIVKNEKDLLKFFIKLWSGLMFILASTFFANQMNLHQVEQSMGVFNIIYFFIIAIYGFAACAISMKDNKPTNCLLTIFAGALIILFYAIIDIIWYNTDQVTVTWLDLVFTSVEFCIGNYIALTIFIINNLKIVDLEKHKKLDEIRESKKLTYEKERRVREEDRRVRDEDRRKILDGLANITIDRRSGGKDRRLNQDRRNPNQTEKDFKEDVAKRTQEMVGYLTNTLDKLDDEINELDEEIRISDQKNIECLEEGNTLCIDVGNGMLVENTDLINDELDDEDDEDDEDDKPIPKKKLTKK